MAKADITFVRGDSHSVQLTPIQGDEIITLSDGDVLHFRAFDGDTAIIQKDLTSAQQDPDSGGITIELLPSDTQTLAITADTDFMWEGEIVFADGRVFTPWHRRYMRILTDRITPSERGAAHD